MIGAPPCLDRFFGQQVSAAIHAAAWRPVVVAGPSFEKNGFRAEAFGGRCGLLTLQRIEITCFGPPQWLGLIWLFFVVLVPEEETLAELRGPPNQERHHFKEGMDPAIDGPTWDHRLVMDEGCHVG